MSVFLTPELEPFMGGTYFPPEDRFRQTGFPTVLRAIAEQVPPYIIISVYTYIYDIQASYIYVTISIYIYIYLSVVLFQRDT